MLLLEKIIKHYVKELMPMLPIVAVTNEKTVKQLAEILNQFFTVSVVTDNIIKIETNSKVLLVNSNNIRELKLDDGILIVSDSCETIFEECFCPIVIADGNKSFLCEKINSKTQYITCGMSAKDTISFSSIDVDEVSVCLMREIKKLNGETVEPYEVTVYSKTNIANYSPFCLLCAFALITVLGVSINGLKLCLE